MWGSPSRLSSSALCWLCALERTHATLSPFRTEEAMAKGILIAAMDYSDVAPDEFNDWYDTEHVPERLAVHGFLNAERWLGGANPKQSGAPYDLDTASVLQSAP